MAHFKAARYPEAERDFGKALKLKEEATPPSERMRNPQLAVVYNNLAATVEKRNSPRDAQALYRHAIAICNNAALPPDHPRVKHIHAKLAELETQLFSFPGL